MRFTPTPTALTLPIMASVPSFTPGAETFIYYTIAQPPPPSPVMGSCLAQLSLVSPTIRHNVTPTVSPGVSPVSAAVAPDIMHLINYGDKDMGLLLSQMSIQFCLSSNTF